MPHQVDIRGRTALLLAAENGHSGVLTLLLAKATLKVEPRNGRRETPLMLAASKGHEGAVKALLDANTNVKAKDSAGWSALTWAVASIKPKVVELLLATGKTDIHEVSLNVLGASLPFAASRGNEEAVKVLLEAGKREKNGVEKMGFWLALQQARDEGELGVVRLLENFERTGRVD